METGLVYLNRQYKFSAAHRLYNRNFSDEKNVQIFKNCNNIEGHGHNFKLIVTLQGVIDQKTGMVYPLDILDKIVDEKVIQLLDHQYLNNIDGLMDVVPTSENVTYKIWDLLSCDLQTSLYKITLYETPRNYFEYYGTDHILTKILPEPKFN